MARTGQWCSAHSHSPAPITTAIAESLSSQELSLSLFTLTAPGACVWVTRVCPVFACSLGAVLASVRLSDSRCVRGPPSALFIPSRGHGAASTCVLLAVRVVSVGACRDKVEGLRTRPAFDVLQAQGCRGVRRQVPGPLDVQASWPHLPRRPLEKRKPGPHSTLPTLTEKLGVGWLAPLLATRWRPPHAGPMGWDTLWPA